MDIHRDRKWAVGYKVWSCGEIRGRATDLAVVGILMIFRAVSPGVVSWVEGVAKERREQRRDPWASPAFIESPEKDGQWGKREKQESVVSSETNVSKWKGWY